MKIKSTMASCVHIPLPYGRQHTCDVGRAPSFDGTLARIDSEGGSLAAPAISAGGKP